MAIDPKQLPDQPVAITFTLQVTIDGHEGPLSIAGASLRDVVKVVRGLAEISALEVLAPPAREWRTLPDGTPICPKHGVPMRLREKQGDTWHSHAVEAPDGTICYCKGYAGKDSPGYEY